MTCATREGKAKPPKWKLISDGDLWEHFYCALKSKGPISCWATWVKGHATDDHIREGVAAEQHKEGNHNTDQIADIGINLHGEDIKKLAIAMHHRHHNYRKFVKDVAPVLCDCWAPRQNVVRIINI